MVWTLLAASERPLDLVFLRGLPRHLTHPEPRGPYPPRHPLFHSAARSTPRQRKVDPAKKQASISRQERRERRIRRAKDGPVRSARGPDGRFVVSRRASDDDHRGSGLEEAQDGRADDASSSEGVETDDLGLHAGAPFVRTPPATETKAQLAGASRTTGGWSRRRANNAVPHLVDMGVSCWSLVLPSSRVTDIRCAEEQNGLAEEEEGSWSSSGSSLDSDSEIEVSIRTPATPSRSRIDGASDLPGSPCSRTRPSYRPPGAGSPSTPLATPSELRLIFPTLPSPSTVKQSPTTWAGWRTVWQAWTATASALSTYKSLLAQDLSSRRARKTVGATLTLRLPSLTGRSGPRRRVSVQSIKKAVYGSADRFNRQNRVLSRLAEVRPDLVAWLDGDDAEAAEEAVRDSPRSWKAMERYLDPLVVDSGRASQTESIDDANDEGEAEVKVDLSPKQRGDPRTPSPSFNSVDLAFGLPTPPNPPRQTPPRARPAQSPPPSSKRKHSCPTLAAVPPDRSRVPSPYGALLVPLVADWDC